MIRNNTCFVTGSSGFIGYFVSKRLLEEGYMVIGIDNMNEYYDANLKRERLKILKEYSKFIFFKKDISNKNNILEIFKEYKPNYVIHLAAQAGVRYSIENPDVYITSNILGTYNILEACRLYPVKHLLYASSSSVYGSNEKVPFEETDFVDQPVSLYAATKKSNELMAFTYSHLYDIPATGLRFFTVYGPMGRPDMAVFKFTELYFKNKPIHIYNNGDLQNDLYRDFTFIDDIIEGIIKLLDKPKGSMTKHQIFNIGNNRPIKLMFFIDSLEKALSVSLGKHVEFTKIFEPIQPGDVVKTYASTNKLEEVVGFKPKTPIKDGLQLFTDWYVAYYIKNNYKC